MRCSAANSISQYGLVTTMELVEMKITYGVQFATDQIGLPSQSSNDDTEGEQTINWDYRDVLPDLKVGDTVSFVIEVADRYPTPRRPPPSNLGHATDHFPYPGRVSRPNR